MSENYKKVLSYAENIVKGNKIACVELKQTCQRFLEDIKNEKYDLDFKTPGKAIKIIESTSVHVKGVKKNTPFLLEDWEKFIIYNLLIFLETGTKKRRFQESFIFLPRKNGKTPFSASLAWALSLLEYRVGIDILPTAKAGGFISD